MAPKGGGAGNRSTPVNRGDFSTRGSGSIANRSGGGIGNTGNRADGSPGVHVRSGSCDEFRKSDDELMEDTQEAAFPTSFASTLDRVPPAYQRYQNEEEFQNIAQQWQQQMQEMEFPIPICDGRNPLFQGAAVLIRLEAAVNETPNPFAQAILTEATSSIAKAIERFELYICMLAEGNWVRAVLELLQSIHGVTGNEGVAERQKKL